MVSLAHLLLLPEPEWEKQQKKFKLPKGKPDMAVLQIIVEVFNKRLTEYPTSLEVRLTVSASLTSTDPHSQPPRMTRNS